MLGRSVQLPIHVRVAHDGLNILAGFGKRNRFDKLLDVAILGSRLPVFDAIVAGVIGGESIFESAKLVYHGSEILRPELEIERRRKQLTRGEVPYLFLLGNSLPDLRQ